jgi:type III secretion system FlhB-like substrate exporter
LRNLTREVLKYVPIAIYTALAHIFSLIFEVYKQMLRPSRDNW